jgi:acyl dehydratase
MTPPVTVGEVIAEQTYLLTRDNLVKYAGASGDFNPIHYRDDVAHSVGLPGVLAHGMLTMGIAIQPVAEWIGDPAKIVDYQVRFTRPVPVDGVDGVTVTVTATVGAVDDDTARIDLTVVAGGATVLGKARVTVRFN